MDCHSRADDEMKQVAVLGTDRKIATLCWGTSSPINGTESTSGNARNDDDRVTIERLLIPVGIHSELSWPN
jgi:hypothetical protein